MFRTFTLKDQLAFARLSGDHNPIHVDPIMARRLMFGGLVVHGVHALLWAIDALLTELEQSGSVNTSVEIEFLKTSFRSPLMVDSQAELSISPSKSGRWKLDVSSNGNRLASTVINLRACDLNTPKFDVLPELPPQTSCRTLTADELQVASGRLPLYLEQNLAISLFPTVSRLLATHHFGTLLATTRLVGMETPGQHSLFTGLELASTCDAAESEVIYQADEFDERFSMLSLKLHGGGLSGSLNAALRPEPACQANFAEMKKMVQSDEFAGCRALIIGGSRGLGEVVVKLLAAGGADVRFTYHRGASEAQRIADDITAGGGVASCFGYDASRDAQHLPEMLFAWSPTAFYYFATPYIGSSTAGRFSFNMFKTFCGVYVEGFLAAFTVIRKLSADLSLVVYPSSSTVDEMPSNLVEYFTAKAAGEKLCDHLRQSNPGMRILAPRLPRLATDQTASLMPLETANPLEVMLRLHRTIWSDPPKEPHS